MENPLFGSSMFSPTSSTPGAINNPVWSTALTDAAGNPSSVGPGMRRLGQLQPWEMVKEPQQPRAPSLAAPLTAASSAAAAMGRDHPEEGAFADALGRLVRGEADAAETIIAYADICRARAAELRDLGSSQLQRAPRFMALSEAAAELEAEAATWQLLWFLHGVPGMDFPAGSGGDFVEGAGFAKTFRQLAADVLFQDEVLNRAGRAVAWLEASATAADPEPDQGLARKDGVWQETKGKLGAGPAARALGATSAATSLVTQLDPDATTRQKARLDVDNTKDEERLMRMVWRFVRGGRIGQAAAACEFAGQPWRSASLTGGGPHGALPLGAAAEDADAADSGLRQAEVLAGEVESGPGMLRALWRWSCYQAAERIAATSQATGSGVHESAVYAVLSSHVMRALPACATWEDSLWCYARCWLDSVVDAELSTAVPWDSNTVPVDALPPGASDADAAAAAEVLSLTAGGWPLPRVRDALPSTLEAAVEAGGSLFGGASTANTGAQRFRRVQLDLILDKVENLVNDALVRWIIDGTDFSSSSTATTTAMNTTTISALGGSDGGPASCPPASLIRFAAHLSLMLWSLNIVAVPDNPDPTAAYSQLHDLLQRLVQVYTVHLIDSGAHALVPSYACHLRAGLRRATYLLFLEQLVVEGDLEGCRAAYGAGAECFKGMGMGDVAQDEMLIIARKAASKAQMESAGGPLQRARSLIWLCFEEDSYADAVRWACVLCREFSLGGPGGVAAAACLLTEILPAAIGGNDNEVEQSSPVDQLLAGAERTGADYEAAELRAWCRFFELEVEFSAWESVYETALREVQAAGEDPRSGILSDLSEDTVPLLKAAVEFVQEGPCLWLVTAPGASDTGLSAPPPIGEIAIVVGPEQDFDGVDALVLSGDAYPTFSSSEEQSRVAAAAAEALRAAAGGSALSFHAGPAPEEGSVHLPGLVSVAVDCGEDEAAQTQAAALISLALKGALYQQQPTPGSSGRVGPFTATNISATPAIVADICRSAVFPRVALRMAALRQAVAFMGSLVEDGAGVVEAVLGDGTVGLFAPEEVRELKELEAAAVALQKKTRQVLARRQEEQQ